MSTIDDIYVCDTRETRAFVKRAIEAGLVPLVRSSPGCGKSAIMRSIAEDYNLDVIDERLSTAVPEDMTGLPHFSKIMLNGVETPVAQFAPFLELFPLEGMPLPKNRDGWMVFFDELNSAEKPMQAAAYKIILDRLVGQKKLHPNVVMTAAGNLDDDRAIVNEMSTALQSRMIHIRMVVKFEHWLKDVALAEHYDERVVAYLSYEPDMLMDFRPDHTDSTFCCPRTWEFMNRLLTDLQGNPRPIADVDTKLFAGTITSGTAAKFVQFTKVYGSLPTIREIRADPTKARMPQDQASRFATVSHVLKHFDEPEFKLDVEYINRYSAEIRVLYYRGLLVRHPQMRSHPEFRKGIAELARYLNDDADEQPAAILNAA